MTAAPLCIHSNVVLDNQVEEIMECGERLGWTLLIAMRCADCGGMMRFNGAMRSAPLTPDEALKGPWSCFGQETMGVMFTPLSAEDAAFPVWGRA